MMLRVLLLLVLALGAPQLAAAQAAPPRPLLRDPFLAPRPALPDSTARAALHLPLLPGAHRSAAPAAAASKRATLLGAGIGFAVGAGATWFVLHEGGSTAPCDRDANQDAMRAGECLALTAAGGAVAALVGVLVARLL